VGPGEGTSTLAIVFVNRGRTDITGVTGYLTLPPGFRAIEGENNVTTPNVAVASYDSTIKAGDTFTMYFTMDVLPQAKVGPYTGDLTLSYSKILEVGQISASMKIPFRITGKVILDIALLEQNLTAGSANLLPILLSNKGTANASGVVATINAINSIQDKVILWIKLSKLVSQSSGQVISLMALYRSLRSSASICCLAKIPPNPYLISCASPVINDSAIAFSTIFTIKISFSHFKATFGLILHDEMGRHLKDRIKTTGPYEIFSSGVRSIHLLPSIYKWNYITVSRISTRITNYNTGFRYQVQLIVLVFANI
jgi:hypothetical protein